MTKRLAEKDEKSLYFKAVEPFAGEGKNYEWSLWVGEDDKGVILQSRSEFPQGGGFYIDEVPDLDAIIELLQGVRKRLETGESLNEV